MGTVLAPGDRTVLVETNRKDLAPLKRKTERKQVNNYVCAGDYAGS